MNNNLTITIEGQTCTGKTTICQFIEKALKKEGFKNIKISGEEENIVEIVEKNYKKKLEAFKNKENFKIEINTKLISGFDILSKEE